MTDQIGFEEWARKGGWRIVEVTSPPVPGDFENGLYKNKGGREFYIIEKDGQTSLSWAANIGHSMLDFREAMHVLLHLYTMQVGDKRTVWP